MNNESIKITVATPTQPKIIGRVVNFKPYGFFVETPDGGFGLVHGKNVKGWNWTKRFDRVFPLGTEVELTLLNTEPETNRMSFACDMPAMTDFEEFIAPSQPAAEPAEAEEKPVELSSPDFEKIAGEWAEREPEKSNTAFEWLKTELADGPLYGPLTTILSDRFDVPVPVSRWIRRFPDFTCYSGKGDNPSDLPAVALSEKAGDLEYWQRIKTKTGDLVEIRNRKEDAAEKCAEFVMKLDALKSFPGSKWILDYMDSCRGLLRGKGVYTAADTTERLAIPMLEQLGWHVTHDNAAFVRNGADGGFNAVIYGGPFGSGKVSLAMMCAGTGTRFESQGDKSPTPALIADRNAIERMLSLYNQIGGAEGIASKLIWTDGTEWVVFSQELIKQRLGVIADRRGSEIMTADDGASFTKVSLPTDGSLSNWLAAFATLSHLISA